MSYYTRKWHRIESPHFIFLISKPEFFNQYSMNALEQFLTYSMDLLNYSTLQKEILRQNKLYYILCENEDQIQQLTGFRIRGMANLAYDDVTTTYNCHYHELLHLLMNYKFQHLPLFTHPFLQEGFAVAFGGRGGLDTSVILNIGTYLYQSGFLDYSELLKKQNFSSLDPSITYPLCGLYTKFLIQEAGIDRFLYLYNKYSYTIPEDTSISIDSIDFPTRAQWQKFILKMLEQQTINFLKPQLTENILNRGTFFKVSEHGSRYSFWMKDTLLIENSQISEMGQSKIFKELLPSRSYQGEQYLFIAQEKEISLYDLFTNNLIANYASAFNLAGSIVPQDKGLWYFSIDKNVFRISLNQAHYHQ
jgi:hypothetical protein